MIEQQGGNGRILCNHIVTTVSIPWEMMNPPRPLESPERSAFADPETTAMKEVVKELQSINRAVQGQDIGCGFAAVVVLLLVAIVAFAGWAPTAVDRLEKRLQAIENKLEAK